MVIANVRLQMDSISGKAPVRAVVEFILGHILLHLLVANFINGLHGGYLA